jgi:hypothetical protein
VSKERWPRATMHMAVPATLSPFGQPGEPGRMGQIGPGIGRRSSMDAWRNGVSRFVVVDARPLFCHAPMSINLLSGSSRRWTGGTPGWMTAVEPQHKHLPRRAWAYWNVLERSRGYSTPR